MKLAQRLFLTYYQLKFTVIEAVSPKRAARSAFQLFCTPYSRRKSYEEPAVFKTAQKLGFTFEKHEIQGFRWKPTNSNGHKVLICHGFDSYSYKFERYIEPLLQEGFEVSAFDAPAHGLSSGKTINALLYSNMIIEAVRRFGYFDAVIAHSFGCIATTLAAEKLKDKAPGRLILIAPATETTRSLDDFCRYLKISAKLRTELEKLIVAVGGQPASWYSVARIIRSISIKTLWIHDKKDTITPYTDMQHLTELNLPHVQFVITEGLGHSLYKEDHIAQQIISFISSINK